MINSISHSDNRRPRSPFCRREGCCITLSALSLRNARRQAHDYLVYFATILMAAALIYAFDSLIFSQEIRTLSELLDRLPLVIGLSSIVVLAIIGWMVYYTLRFMLTKRAREFGTYILIGLENREVSRLFLLENMIVGGAALVLGILAGNLLFQVLRALLLSMFDTSYTLSLSLSMEAAGLTLLSFLLIYLPALLCCTRSIRRMSIHDFLSMDRQNDEAVIRRGSTRRRIFLFSPILGAGGFLMLLTRSLFPGILGAAMLILFLYGFFISFSSGVPAWFDRHPHQKYKGLALPLFRSLSAKLAATGIVMATVSLLLTATFLTEGSGILFHILLQYRAEQTTCFDLFLSSQERGWDNFQDYQACIDSRLSVRSSHRYAVYEGDNLQITNYVISQEDYWQYFPADIIMKKSDYDTLRAMLGYPKASLEEGHFLIHCLPYLEKSLSAYTEPITVGGRTLLPQSVYTESFTQTLWDGNGRGFLIVVSDEAVSGLPISRRMLALLTQEPLTETDYDALCRIRDAKAGSPGHDTLFSLTKERLEAAGTGALLVFPLIYLALVLTMVSSTILTIQQLAETSRMKAQFSLLHKLGMEPVEMRRTLRRQFLLFYGMPALPPLLIGTGFVLSLGNSFDPGVFTGTGELVRITACIAGIFLTAYLLYAWLAYESMRKDVMPEG